MLDGGAIPGRVDVSEVNNWDIRRILEDGVDFFCTNQANPAAAAIAKVSRSSASLACLPRPISKGLDMEAEQILV